MQGRGLPLFRDVELALELVELAPIAVAAVETETLDAYRHFDEFAVAAADYREDHSVRSVLVGVCTAEWGGGQGEEEDDQFLCWHYLIIIGVVLSIET